MSSLLQTLLPFVLSLSLIATFSPNVFYYDSYGVRVAANNLMFGSVDFFKFIIILTTTLTNYTDDDVLQGCEIYYEFDSHYVYTIALGKNQSTYNFFFVGELTNLPEDREIANRTFIGMVSYRSSLDTTDDVDSCDLDIQYVSDPYRHQEHLVMVTDPLGSVAYVFSDFFTLSYTAATKRLIVNRNNSLSPTTRFLPFAVDYDGTHGIIAGYLEYNLNRLDIRYSPTVILFTIDALTSVPTAISNWSYPINGTTWQAGLIKQDVNQYDAKFKMSVSINPTATQVLVGIQWMNMVFLFNYTRTSLTLITSKDNGPKTVGFGKSVAWFSDGVDRFAILANVYSRSYDWISSQINIYNSPLTNISKPFSVFPNIQQPLYSDMSPVFLYIITTPTHLVLVDTEGSPFFILSAPEGYYSRELSFGSGISSYVPCIAGTYKNVTGIFPCSLCPPGTKSDGTNATLTGCVDCAMNAFCPLGSVTDSISNDQLSNVVQVGAYPKSPDISGLDDILFLTMFTIGSTPRCIALSPIFWTLIVAAIVILITIVVLVIKRSVANPKAVNTTNKFLLLCKRIDLIREGEMWVGGLTTFCVVVLCISCCVFSGKYYTSYPIETAEPSTYTCDTSLRNAKFSSSLQSSSIPVSDNMEKMIKMLNDQVVNLDVALINTMYNCTSDEAILTFLSGAEFLPVPIDPCNSSNYIVSYRARLPFRLTTVRFTLPNIRPIGGLRIGLRAPGSSEFSRITLRDLAFSNTFSKTERTLGPNVYIDLQLTKLINSTSPLVNGGDDILSGIWTGSFTINYNESFISDADYLTLSPNGTETRLKIVISETPYYILNEQSPIARLPEIIYHNFLFITMIIGMFVLIFIITEVMILPCLVSCVRKCKRKSSEKCRTTGSRRSSSPHDNLQNLTSPSNKQESTSHERINVSFIQEPTFTSNEHADRGKNYKKLVLYHGAYL